MFSAPSTSFPTPLPPPLRPRVCQLMVHYIVVAIPHGNELFITWSVQTCQVSLTWIETHALTHFFGSLLLLKQWHGSLHWHFTSILMHTKSYVRGNLIAAHAGFIIAPIMQFLLVFPSMCLEVPSTPLLSSSAGSSLHWKVAMETSRATPSLSGRWQPTLWPTTAKEGFVLNWS